MNDIQKLELMKEYFSLIEKSLHIVRIALNLKISDETQEEFNKLLDQASALNKDADKILDKVHDPKELFNFINN